MTLPRARLAVLAAGLALTLSGALGCDGSEVCDNGVDDDGDGDVDCNDPDCAAECAGAGEGEAGEGEGEAGEGEGEGGEGEAGEGEGEAGEGEGEGEGDAGEGEGEVPNVANCHDGADNDGDFLVDRADPGCRDDTLDVEGDDDQCNNGIDDDYDGLADDLDPDCVSAGRETDPEKLPDLVVLGEQANAGVDPTLVQVNDGNPELLERCYKGTGQRRLLRFDTVVANMGPGILDYVSPEDHPDVWVVNALNNGPQFAGWSRFTVKDADGNAVASGHKASFCMVDTDTVVPGSPRTLNGCDGLDVFYYDVYFSGLPCQFVDVTGVPAGNYTLTIETNVFHDIPENNFDNNSADIPVTIPP